MKNKFTRLLIGIMLMLTTISVSAQELDFLESMQMWMEKEALVFFFLEWDLELEANQLSADEIILTDNFAEDIDDIKDTVATIVFAIYDEAVYQGITAEQLPFETLKYESKYREGWVLIMTRDWFVKYFATNRDKYKTLLVKDLIDKQL